MSLEFKIDETPVEVGAEFKIITSYHSGRKLVSDNRTAFEILPRGKNYDRLLAEYEAQHRRPKAEVVTTPLRKTAESVSVTPPVTVPVTQSVVVVEPAEVQVIDEEAEAQEFIDATEPFVPKPEDWYRGETVSAFPGMHCIFAVLDNGEKVYIQNRDITVSPGDHHYCQRGAEIWLRLELNPRTGKRVAPYKALECQIIDENYRAGRESGVISAWRGSYGVADRPCGCPLFVMLSSKSFVGVHDFNVGDEVEFDMVWSEKKKSYIGDNVKRSEI